MGWKDQQRAKLLAQYLKGPTPLLSTPPMDAGQELRYQQALQARQMNSPASFASGLLGMVPVLGDAVGAYQAVTAPRSRFKDSAQTTTGKTIGGLLDKADLAARGMAIAAPGLLGLGALHAMAGPRQNLGPLAKAYPKQQGIFAGVNAANADLDALDTAKAMLAKGDAPADVWRATGWGVGPDGKWRFEISDREAAFKAKDGRYLNLNTEANSAGEWTSMPVGEFLSHQDLEAAYPYLGRQVNLTLKDYGGGAEYRDSSAYESIALGSAFKKQPIATPTDGPFPITPEEAAALNAESQAMGTHRIPSPETTKSLLIHELQHAVQSREGFSPGGDPKDKDAYLRLAGEAEARMAQNRINWPADMRRKSYPWDEDYFKYATGVDLGSLVHWRR